MSMYRLAALLLLLPLASPAHAAPGDPRCAADLQRASDLVDRVAGRDRGGPYGASQVCSMLRANLSDMQEAAILMRRCMSGHALRENVGQMDASIEDVRAVVAKRCN